MTKKVEEGGPFVRTLPPIVMPQEPFVKLVDNQDILVSETVRGFCSLYWGHYAQNEQAD